MSIQKLKKAVAAYYRGQPTMTDAQYDELYFSLKAQFPKDPFFKTVGKQVSKNKAKLLFKRGSLTKSNPQQAIDWLSQTDESVIVTPKYDGLSITLDYDAKGNFVRATTRGDGTYGEDVTDRAIHFKGFVKKINPKSGIVSVTGEALIDKKTFEKKYADKYAMSRNLTVGKIKSDLSASAYRLKTKPEDFDVLKDISFITYTSNLESKSKTLRYLDKLGFLTAKILYAGDRLTSNLIDSLLKKRDPSFDCDGIVIDIDSPKAIRKYGYQSDGKTPAFAIAVKPERNDQESAEAVISHIDWQMNKTGNLVPVAKLVEPIKLSGASISSISLSNYDRWKSEGFGDGATVRIVRSGDVIPYADIVKAAPTRVSAKCPYCGGKVRKHGVHLNCPNQDCSGMQLSALHNFFLKMKVDDIGFGTIKQLSDAGYDTVTKIVALRESQLLRLDKWGSTRAKKFVSEMQRIKNCDLVDLMHASNCFNDGITGLGKTVLTTVIEELGEKTLTGVLESDLDGLEHFGKGRVKLYMSCQENWLRMYHKQLKHHFNVTVRKEVKKGPLTGMTFCWTGFRDKALKEWIENNGGIMKDGLNKTVNVLFAAKPSTKTRKADALGIKVVASSDAQMYIKRLLNK